MTTYPVISGVERVTCRRKTDTTLDCNISVSRPGFNQSPVQRDGGNPVSVAIKNPKSSNCYVTAREDIGGTTHCRWEMRGFDCLVEDDELVCAQEI